MKTQTNNGMIIISQIPKYAIIISYSLFVDPKFFNHRGYVSDTQYITTVEIVKNVTMEYNMFLI